ncbi:MIP/aquaporin family protein [Arthrobacter caoxuetaonis]|uniref:Aquaporin n=1 Tax=Arthrobacter caoxuetaonis TaxID=2886935 RepID=A0A9X1MCP0_9MICC|nr:aquaporin [Arthrobacter caoxuetaonis]MCC3280845.1 aquaporin [Arthrobacter caoxuetaonis]MCC3296915.1 aquaporin [Arthrobacter caoxuetaonis]USQ56272.1 aquaporin [Arthrobacter caoxuetaonis]
MTAEPHFPAGASAAETGSARITPLRSYGLVGRSIAEAAGSFLLVLAGLGVSFFNPSGGLSAPLAFGLVLAAAIIAFGYISGGHFLPTITVASALAGRTSWKSVVPYIVAQVVGALLAAVILWVSMTGHPQIPETQPFFSAVANGFAEHSATQFPLAGALLTEVIAAALLTAVFLGGGTRMTSAAAAFATGVTYAALLTFLVPITGGSINPARSTATAVFAESWALGELWLFWVAPLLGAAITGLIYRSLDLSASPAVQVTEGEPDDADGGTAAASRLSPETGTAPAVQADPQQDNEARGFFDKDDARDSDGDPDNGTADPRRS